MLTHTNVHRHSQAHVCLISTAVIMHYVYAYVPSTTDRGENDQDSCMPQEVWDMLVGRAVLKTVKHYY